MGPTEKLQILTEDTSRYEYFGRLCIFGRAFVCSPDSVLPLGDLTRNKHCKFQFKIIEKNLKMSIVP